MCIKNVNVTLSHIDGSTCHPNTRGIFLPVHVICVFASSFLLFQGCEFSLLSVQKHNISKKKICATLVSSVNDLVPEWGLLFSTYAMLVLARILMLICEMH